MSAKYGLYTTVLGVGSENDLLKPLPLRTDCAAGLVTLSDIAALAEMASERDSCPEIYSGELKPDGYYEESDRHKAYIVSSTVCPLLCEKGSSSIRLKKAIVSVSGPVDGNINIRRTSMIDPSGSLDEMTVDQLLALDTVYFTHTLNLARADDLRKLFYAMKCDRRRVIRFDGSPGGGGVNGFVGNYEGMSEDPITPAPDYTVTEAVRAQSGAYSCNAVCVVDITTYKYAEIVRAYRYSGDWALERDFYTPSEDNILGEIDGVPISCTECTNTIEQGNYGMYVCPKHGPVCIKRSKYIGGKTEYVKSGLTKKDGGWFVDNASEIIKEAEEKCKSKFTDGNENAYYNSEANVERVVCDITFPADSILKDWKWEPSK